MSHPATVVLTVSFILLSAWVVLFSIVDAEEPKPQTQRIVGRATNKDLASFVTEWNLWAANPRQDLTYSLDAKDIQQWHIVAKRFHALESDMKRLGYE